MPWINLHPLYSSRLTKSKRWIARKAVIDLANGGTHDPNLHPHYEEDDAELYPWTSSTFPRPKGGDYDRQLRQRVREKYDDQYEANVSPGNQYGFREGVEPVYGPERPRSNLHHEIRLKQASWDHMPFDELRTYHKVLKPEGRTNSQSGDLGRNLQESHGLDENHWSSPGTRQAKGTGGSIA
ncbi:hypothetical protein BT69DRAFT_1306599 [Atractiella rhizophila]|nr:hypothetical protein BT69DRAFT_1306599 [Atractiella rhizophila]